MVRWADLLGIHVFWPGELDIMLPMGGWGGVCRFGFEGSACHPRLPHTCSKLLSAVLDRILFAFSSALDSSMNRMSSWYTSGVREIVSAVGNAESKINVADFSGGGHAWGGLVEYVWGILGNALVYRVCVASRHF